MVKRSTAIVLLTSNKSKHYNQNMKTWFTYIASVLFAAATAFLFADYEIASTTFSYASTYLLRIGTLVTIPLVVFSLSSAIASIRKDKLGEKVFFPLITWTFVTSLLLPIVPAVFFYLYPSAFPVTSSAGSSGDIVGYYINYAIDANLNALGVINPFNAMATASSIILPLVILSWIFGLFLNPSSDTIRPAYAVMNSFSEIMHKIARFYTVYGYIIAYFAFTDLFLSIYVEKTALVVPGFIVMLLIITAIILFVLLPLLFAIFTKFKKNPYKVLALSISSLFMSLSSGNTLNAVATNIATSRLSLGVQKRNAVTSTFFYTLFAKGGSAAIGTFLTLTLITAMGGILDQSTIIFVALATTASSFISFSSFGMESIITTYVALKLLNVDLYGAESALLSISMITNGLSSLIDSAIMAMGTKVVSVKTKTDIEVPYKDYI